MPLGGVMEMAKHFKLMHYSDPSILKIQGISQIIPLGKGKENNLT